MKTSLSSTFLLQNLFQDLFNHAIFWYSHFLKSELLYFSFTFFKSVHVQTFFCIHFSKNQKCSNIFARTCICDDDDISDCVLMRRSGMTTTWGGTTVNMEESRTSGSLLTSCGNRTCSCTIGESTTNGYDTKPYNFIFSSFQFQNT